MDQKIRVLHVISDTGIGGAGVLLCRLLGALDGSVFYPGALLPEGSLLIPRLTSLSIPVMTMTHGADQAADLWAVPQVISAIRRFRPDLVHTHGALYGRMAGRLLGIPLCYTRHCADSLASPGTMRRLSGKATAKILGDQVIATADYVQDILMAEGVPKKNIHIIYNGVEPLMPGLPDQVTHLRQRLGLLPRHFVVGMVARLVPGKGHEVLLRAARQCVRESPDLRFVLAGDGPREAELRRLVASWGLSPYVKFAGFLEDVAPLFSLLSVNVNASLRSETSSLSLSEGMSLGVVPVVSDCGGNAFMADHGRCGAVFPAGDSRALASILISLSRAPHTMTALSAAARMHFEKHFTAAAMARRVEGLYRQLL